MFFKGIVDGLSPDGSYAVTISVEVATDTPAGGVGVGGPPGESVWIKAGATAVEPLPVRDGSYLRMNVYIGRQSAGGAQTVVLGDIANSRSCEQSRRWEIKSFQGRSTPVPISIPSNGQAWLLFGAGSGFEARTGIYFTRAAGGMRIVRSSSGQPLAGYRFAAHRPRLWRWLRWRGFSPRRFRTDCLPGR